MAWHTRRVASAYDALAPDGSEIRLLPQVEGANMQHCRLPAGQVWRTLAHVEGVLDGSGAWRWTPG